MSRFVKYIHPVSAKKAEGLVAQIYSQTKRDLGAVVEPLTIHSPLPELLAGVWSLLRETVLVGKVRRGIKEAVAGAISQINRCPWCVDAHTMMLHATGDHSVVAAISHAANNRALVDPQMRSIIQWASATRTPNAEILLSPPFSSQEAPEIIGTAITFHYVNRMVTVLLTETFLPKQPWLKNALKRSVGWFLSSSANRAKVAGGSLKFLPEARLPADLAWAAGAPHVSGAFARFAAVVERTGANTLSTTVRDLVSHHVQSWDGSDPGLGKQWVERAVGGLGDEMQAAARLTLLTALAPFQVDAGVIDSFRKHQPGDDELVGALAWAGFAAARRIGAWLGRPSRT